MVILGIALVLVVGTLVMVRAVAGRTAQNFANNSFEVQSLDGRGNNLAHPDAGQAGTPYLRIAAATYADGMSVPMPGPNSRLVSNRIFNDIGQNIFSERGVSQWGWNWGLFLDFDMAFRDGKGTPANIAFNKGDPVEDFGTAAGTIGFTRSKIAPGTGVATPAQQINTNSSYLDASQVYGVTQSRLDFIRAGTPGKSSALMMLPGGQLPRRDARGDAAKAPESQTLGRLAATPAKAAVGGEIRINENIEVQATQTLFAREHNRIVSKLPTSLTEEERFQIARRVVIAEEQFITYNEFLPAMGLKLAPYKGYDPNVNATVSNEFAAVGFRIHSAIHGELEVETEADRYSENQLTDFVAKGINVERSADGKEVTVDIPNNVLLFNPDLVAQVQVGPILKAIGAERQYRNDEQIDNSLRSILFQLPLKNDNSCLDPPSKDCFVGSNDLGAIDIERGRDHGMPNYNDMRRAFGLAPEATFEGITGEQTATFAADPVLKTGNEINDRRSLDFVKLLDTDGKEVRAGSNDAQEEVTEAVRRTPLAARLKAIYGSVDRVDAFTGMVSEKHVEGTEFGELQLAIWKQQFEALRDGDRFFFGNDPGLTSIQQEFGLDFRRNLGDIIALNTDIPRDDLSENVFLVEEEDGENNSDKDDPDKDDPDKDNDANKVKSPSKGKSATPTPSVSRSRGPQAADYGTATVGRSAVDSQPYSSIEKQSASLGRRQWWAGG